MANSNGYAEVQKIDLHEFIAKRAHEMEAMMQSSRDAKENHRIIQKLPRHMRRRAASHDVRRLPLALRAAASKEAKKSGNPRTSKRPSRRYRRRPRNLLLDYARRKRKHVWLETHIWHAKRFHMTERWGYKIPLHSNERGVRAAYRSATDQCLIFDLSYYCCIQLTGLEKDILKELCRLTSSSNDSSTFSSRACIEGTKEGRCSIYSDRCYPKSVLGEVTFMWKPIGQLLPNETVLSSKKEMSTKETSPEVGKVSVGQAEKEAFRNIWIWTHPSSYAAILNEMKNVFSMQAVEDTQSDMSDTLKCPRGALFTNGSVTMESLKDELCRFKLIGHQSLAVLQDALRLAKVQQSKELTALEVESESTVPCKRFKCSEESASTGPAEESPSWWEMFCSDEKNVKNFEAQTKIWSSLLSVSSPAELSPSSIYGLTVRDPRLFLPQKKSLNSDQREFGNVNSEAICRTILSSISQSMIWDKRIRAEVAQTKLTTSELNDLRSNYIVPGSEPELGSRESRIPILLVQNPGIRSSTSGISRPSFGCGFDIILPAGWATSFWISLIYRRAQPAGLKEHVSVTFESGKLLSPESYPDSLSGEEMNVTAYRERYEKYCRMPPAKRCNYVKAGVVAPFHFPWKELVAEWLVKSGTQVNNSLDSFYVLRNRQYLRVLIDRGLRRGGSPQPGESIRTKREASQTKKPRPIILLRRPGGLNAPNFGSNQEINMKTTSKVETKLSTDLHAAFRNEPCLIPVHVRLRDRGAPSRYSMICIPATEDLSASSIALNTAGPVESRHGRNNLDNQNLTKNCTVTKETSTTDTQKQGSKKVTKKISVKKVPIDFGSLPLPVCKKVVESSTRLVIGYIVEGGFSHASGCVKGLGFVSLQGLLTLLDTQRKSDTEIEVLVRTTSSYQYRRALLTVNMDFTS